MSGKPVAEIEATDRIRQMTDEPFSDDKDWTWVLNELCPECEYEVREFDVASIPDRIRSNAAEWVGLLTEVDEAILRQRPREDRWSALEYASHVRDVFGLYNYRLGLMLNEDGPHYPNWNQDETAVEKDYRAADPDRVSEELRAAAEALARHFETVEGDEWERTGFRSDGAAFTVETFARYLMHDPAHHLWDVRTGLDQIGV